MENKILEFYEALNDEKYNSFYHLNIEFKKNLRNIYCDLKNPEDIRNAALLEDCVLQFQLAGDELIDFDTKSFRFDVNKKNMEYFENRVKQAVNPFVLARYNHILWIVKKHNNYALEAIKYYFIAKEIVIKQKDTCKEWTFDFLECLKRSFLIKRRISNKADSFNIEKEFILSISKFIEEEKGLVLSIRLLTIILASTKYFKNLLDRNFLNNINQFAKKLINKEEAFHAIRLLEILIKIAEKINIDTTAMYENLGAANEARIYEFNKSNASLSYCLDAIKIYSKLKRKEKVDELNIIYEEITDNMHFGMVTTKVNIKPIINNAKKIVKKLIKMPFNDIIRFFIYDKYFIPSNDSILSQAKKEEPGFLTSLLGINIDVFDQRGNRVKIYSTEEEKLKQKTIQFFNWEIQFRVISLNYILKELIMAKKITFDEIYNYMINNTWISHIFNKSINNGQKTKYTYSNILQTLLKEYFRIYNENILFNALPCTEFMLFIDSASLKIEGLIRGLFTLNNYPTFMLDPNNGTTREKDLYALLNDEKIKNFFDEDELLFYNCLFVEQGGLNIRNHTAHSLLLEQEYNMGIANLVFFSLLRFFKFEF